jgi:hypothetical protein
VGLRQDEKHASQTGKNLLGRGVFRCFTPPEEQGDNPLLKNNPQQSASEMIYSVAGTGKWL